MTVVADTAKEEAGCPEEERQKDTDEDQDWKTPDPESCATLCNTKFIQYYAFASGNGGYCSCFPECDLTRPATSYKENAAKVYEVVGKILCSLKFRYMLYKIGSRLSFT